jgi:hypothetical protein
MSQIACPYTLTNAGYPPIKKTAVDVQNEAKLQALQAAAPFGRAPGGAAVNELQYQKAMQQSISDAYAIDFRWPFWVGLGVGSLGLAIMVVRERW